MESRPRPAPGRLQVIEEFVNTLDIERGTEALGSPAALGDWLARHELLPTGSVLTADDLARTIELREALRASLLAHSEKRSEAEAVAVLDRIASDTPLRLRFDADGGVHLAPLAKDLPGALARLLAIVYQAMQDGTWGRLKACPAGDCKWAFYDHSKNRSGVWCDMAVCGNRTKTRSYRRRAARAR